MDVPTKNAASKNDLGVGRVHLVHSDHIVLSLNDQIGHGAFADVFADSRETVVKFFYRRDPLATRPPERHGREPRT